MVWAPRGENPDTGTTRTTHTLPHRLDQQNSQNEPDVPLSLLPRLIQHPGVGKGRLAHLLGLLLVLVHLSLVHLEREREREKTLESGMIF